MSATKRCQRAIEEIRDHRRRACFHELTFVDMPVPTSPAQKKWLEAQLRRSFDLWWDSWIEPRLEIIAKG